MPSFKILKLTTFLLIVSFFLNACSGMPGADARKYPADPKKRVAQNVAQGKGFTLMNSMGGSKGGVFEFASSNELWRASLDTIDFMPLISANYSGGIIITDWYSDGKGTGESIKVSIRFLTNEIRADALDIKVFMKKCKNLNDCRVSESKGVLVTELKKKILRQASIYKAENKKKNYKKYDNTNMKPTKKKKK